MNRTRYLSTHVQRVCDQKAHNTNTNTYTLWRRGTRYCVTFMCNYCVRFNYLCTTQDSVSLIRHGTLRKCVSDVEYYYD